LGVEKMKRKKIVILSTFLLFGLNSYVLAEQSEVGENQKSYFKVWIGYDSYKMTEFNEKLSNENNKPIKGGINAGIELNVVDISIFKSGIHVKAPFGIEYFNAASVTTHSYEGGSVTVDWKIPVVGIYIAPSISIKKIGGFYIRPIGIGYYNLGKVFDARLLITDRPGRLEASGDAVGFLSILGMKYSTEEFKIFAEAGYRWLEFSDVFLDPKDGFTETAGGSMVQPGYLPENLDYSGFIFKIGVEINLSSPEKSSDI